MDKKKKLFNSLEVDLDNKILMVESKGKEMTYDFDSIGFSLFEYRNYSVLVLYEKLTGSRGQPLLKEVGNFTAFPINISWGRSQLRFISENLRSFQIEECQGKDKPVLDRIF